MRAIRIIVAGHFHAHLTCEHRGLVGVVRPEVLVVAYVPRPLRMAVNTHVSHTGGAELILARAVVRVVACGARDARGGVIQWFFRAALDDLVHVAFRRVTLRAAPTVVAH